MKAKDKLGQKDLHHYRNYINRDSRLLRIQFIFSLFVLAGLLTYYFLLE